MPNSLQTLQETFQDYLLEKDTQMEEFIVADDTRPAHLRLEVYRHAYSARLANILAINFPMLQKMLGEEDFKKIAYEYIDTYPSNHFSIRFFGRHFSKFLASYPGLERVYAEMAAFEWAIEECQDALDAPHLTVEEMSTISPDEWAGMQFVFHPALIILPLAFNVPELWQALSNDEAMPEVQYSETKVYWLIWSMDLKYYFTYVTEQQYHVIKAIQAGKNFGEICEELCEWLPEEEVIQFAAGSLRNWISDGVFTRVIINSQKEETITEYCT